MNRGVIKSVQIDTTSGEPIIKHNGKFIVLDVFYLDDLSETYEKWVKIESANYNCLPIALANKFVNSNGVLNVDSIYEYEVNEVNLSTYKIEVDWSVLIPNAKMLKAIILSI
ncbi:MAG: hypothetical protein ACK5B9_03225 [Flavobacteriia bacterium]|jgi:hypothetical protein